MYSRIYVRRRKNGVYAKPVVYRWCIQNTTAYELFKVSKGMHVTLSGVCVCWIIYSQILLWQIVDLSFIWLLNECLYIYTNFSSAFIKFPLLTTCTNSMTSSLGPMECRFS